MISAKWINGTALAVVFAIAAATHLSAADNGSAKPVKPYQAISLDAGTKHVSGYFSSVDGQCALTVMIGDSYRENDVLIASPVMRMQVTVNSDKPARFDTSGGKLAQFECLPGAQAMKATVRDQVAIVTAP